MSMPRLISPAPFLPKPRMTLPATGQVQSMPPAAAGVAGWDAGAAAGDTAGAAGAAAGTPGAAAGTETGFRGGSVLSNARTSASAVSEYAILPPFGSRTTPPATTDEEPVEATVVVVTC